MIFLRFPTQSMDWVVTFFPVSKNPLDPYLNKFFVNPPWTTVIIYPLHFFSEQLSLAINSSLNLVCIGLLVINRKGGIFSLFLTLTSFPFLSLLANGNIEWIPALGFIFQNMWGFVLLLCKPQSGILAGLNWFLQSRRKYLFLLPTVLIVLGSFLLWGNWPVSIIANSSYMAKENIGLFNDSISPFPWAIPIGIGLIAYILKFRPKESETLGVIATLCLMPYFVVHSLVILFALICSTHRRLSIICWFLLWLYPIVSNWSHFLRLIGVL